MGYGIHSTVAVSSSASFYIVDRLVNCNANNAGFGVIKFSTTASNIVATKADLILLYANFKAAYSTDLAIDA